MGFTFNVSGLEKLERDFAKLGKVPLKVVTPSAQKGMNIVLKAAKAAAPVGETGQLKKGMVLKGEMSRYKGKKVFQVVFDPKFNEIFQKKNAKGKVTGYYPFSMEYGYFTRDGRYIPGYNFVRSQFTRGRLHMVSRLTIKTAQGLLDKELKKAGLK